MQFRRYDRGQTSTHKHTRSLLYSETTTDFDGSLTVLLRLCKCKQPAPTMSLTPAFSNSFSTYFAHPPGAANVPARQSRPKFAWGCMHSSSSFTEGEKLQGRRRSLAGLAAEAYPATVPVCPSRLMHMTNRMSTWVICILSSQITSY